MPAIRIGTRLLELAGKTPLVLERNSPLLSDPGETGSSSAVFRVPKTDANNVKLGFPNRFDHRAGSAPAQHEAQALDEFSNEVTTGNLLLRGVEPDAYLYNLEFGDSAAMARLKSRTLQQFRFGGARSVYPTVPLTPADEYDGTTALGVFLKHVATHFEDYDFTFAPFSNNNASGGWQDYVAGIESYNSANPTTLPAYEARHTYSHNHWSTLENTFATPNVCPLPKLEYVLRTIFKELRLELETDVFEDADMRKLVLLPITGRFADPRYLTFPGAPSSWVVGQTLSKITVGNFLIADLLPAMTAQEFVRKLMDEFGWHFDTTPTGVCRLLRATPLMTTGNAIDITALTGPAFSTEFTDPTSVVVQPTFAEADEYAAEYGEQPDPLLILAPVASVATLPATSEVDRYCLVKEKRRYYVATAKTDSSTNPPTATVYWRPGPFYLPGMQIGTAEATDDYALGCDTVLTAPVQIYSQNLLNAQQVDTLEIDALCFLEMASADETPSLTTGQTSTASGIFLTPTQAKSRSLRLAFYHGLQPTAAYARDGSPALIPWLSQRNLSPTGSRIGELTLEAHGPYGLVQQRLLPLMTFKATASIAKFPAFFTPYLFHKLDFSRTVSIRGDEFMVRRLSMVVPTTTPGQLELIPRAQLTRLTARPTVSDNFYVGTGTPETARVCNLLIMEVQRTAGNVATVVTQGTQGAQKFQLDMGTPQDSPVFTGLVAGRQYVFWAYDLSVPGCNRFVNVTW